MSYEPPGGSLPPPPSGPPMQGWAPAPVGAPYPATGYQPYGGGYGGPPRAQFQSLRGLGTALVWLFAVEVVLSVLGAVFLFNRAGLADDFADTLRNRDFSSFSVLSDVKDADSRVALAVVPFFFVFIAIASCFIVWQYRHAKNAEAMRGPLGLGAGWAIGGWFIPLANYVLPQMQLGQAAKASDPELPAGAPRTSGRLPGIIVGWAVALALAAVVYSGSLINRPNTNEFGFTPTAQTFNDIASSDRGEAVGLLAYAAAAALGLVMVRDLGQRQEKAWTRTVAERGNQPDPTPWQQQPQMWQQPPPQAWQPPPPQTWAPPPPNETWRPPDPPLR